MRTDKALFALAGVASVAEAAEAKKKDSLVPMVFTPLPLGSISPSGWLRDQMQLMADGLAGHEHDFYDYVAHSSWIGQSQEYSDLREGLPYWFNGIVPLAYGLDDATLKSQVASVANYVIDHQWDDGWIGPENSTERNFWGRYPLFLGLTGLVEADKATWEPKVIPAMEKFFGLMNTALKNNYTYYWYHPDNIYSTGDVQWGQVRSQDMMLSLQWMYEHYPGNQSELLLENMKMMHDGGINWEDWYNEGTYFGLGINKPIDTLPDSSTGFDQFPYLHGVNVGQGLKAVAVVRRFTHNDTLSQIAMNGVNWTMTYHGASSGMIIADEREEGLAPYNGGEFCTAVETAFSLSYLYQALGENYYADHAELVAFNAMPAMATPDWWGRQYMTQANQPYAQNLTDVPFWNVNSWGQTYGLEPDYPCCTVNHPQGWPKFLSNSYAMVGTNGLAHMLLSPGTAKASLSGGQATVICATAYPFGDTLSYTVKAASPMDFYVRVPSWADPSTASIKVNSKSIKLAPNTQTGMQKLSLPKGTSHITYTLPATITTQPREHDSIAVYRGSVLYALEISNRNTSTTPKPYSDPNSYFPTDYAPPQSRDWEYHNTSAWNYAIDPSTLKYHGPTGTSAVTVGNPLFGPGGPPGYMTAQACEIDWPMAFNGAVPGLPPTGQKKKCIKDKVQVKLVPFGSAKTRMSELPVMLAKS